MSQIQPIYDSATLDSYNQWWVEKSRVNFFAYRWYMRANAYVYNWFIEQICVDLQQFYIDLMAGKSPILVIQSPPQHGKSWSVIDFISWICGKNPQLRAIYASYSDTLGIRCNTMLQRFFDSEKHQNIFPGFRINKSNVVTVSNKSKRNSNLIEFLDGDGAPTEGQFRNTTVRGSVTGETLDIGIIDDPVKGREQASSISYSEKIWEWFTDDFGTRFAEHAGLLVIMTPWTTHDLSARIIKAYEGDPRLKVARYPAIAPYADAHRAEGEALFPQLKSKTFLLAKQAVMHANSWESLYQCSPTVRGGNMVKDDWWKWWRVLPPIRYKFITADTAQKTKEQNDWTVFQLWGYGVDNNIYLMDRLRAKMGAPTLRREAEAFYATHDKPRVNLMDPVLRGMYIEDKSSGTGLIQELRAKKLKIVEIPRIKDKVLRAEDGIPYIESGRVYLNAAISGINNLTKEAREFPNSSFDDDFDTLLTAIEVAFINKNLSNSLKAAMEADD